MRLDDPSYTYGEVRERVGEWVGGYIGCSRGDLTAQLLDVVFENYILFCFLSLPFIFSLSVFVKLVVLSLTL